MVVAGDGALSLSGSGSSDSTSKDVCVWRAEEGGGPDGSGGVGWDGGMLEEAPSRVGEPNLFTCSTMEVVRGRFEDRRGGGSSGNVTERGAVDRDACLAGGAGRSHSYERGRSSTIWMSS